VSAFTEKLALNGILPDILRRAAALHDLGKADRRFQYLLYGDEPGDTLLAKSGQDLGARQRAAVRRAAGLPEGFRHEFVSVALLRQHHPQLLEGLAERQRCMVEWLVGTHHGRGRPFVPYIEERASAEPVMLHWAGHGLRADPNHQLWRLDAGWADAFWHLVRQHGYWGLAYLETLLRLADGAQSAEEQAVKEMPS
jgi:CRISPR-associated endonuclease/helicase Cas3